MKKARMLVALAAALGALGCAREAKVASFATAGVGEQRAIEVKLVGDKTRYRIERTRPDLVVLVGRLADALRREAPVRVKTDGDLLTDVDGDLDDVAMRSCAKEKVAESEPLNRFETSGSAGVDFFTGSNRAKRLRVTSARFVANVATIVLAWQKDLLFATSEAKLDDDTDEVTVVCLQEGK